MLEFNKKTYYYEKVGEKQILYILVENRGKVKKTILRRENA
jgi:hypothetical protein